MKSNKGVALRVLLGILVDRDRTVADRYFSETYLQHNPTMPNGSAAILHLIDQLGPDFSYELGMNAAEGNIVMIHGRYKGWQGKTFVAVDIFRVENGLVTEHWDVTQEEVPTENTVSGNPMFSLCS